MTPYYEHAGIVIYHGDCREILPTLPKCDLLLTDPPYGHGDRWQGGTWGAAQMYRDAEIWDAETIPDDLLSLAIRSAAGAIVWGGNYYTLTPSRCWLAWIKNPAMDTMADFELAWTSFDRPAKKFIENRNPDGKRYHPTQKPLSLFRWCLSLFPDAKTVLDPFCGSGTTLVAAKAMGLTAIGIELHEPYAEICAKRLSQEVFDFTDVSVLGPGSAYPSSPEPPTSPRPAPSSTE